MNGLLTGVPNAGRLYFYSYYKNMNVGYVEGALRGILPNSDRVANQLTKELTKESLQALDDFFEPMGNGQFVLVTTYPGLLIGTGITHETGADKELLLGFTFDHTTGLPIVPGSSVKGVLRSAFDEQAYPGYLVELLQSKLGDFPLPEGFSLMALEEEIFGPRPSMERNGGTSIAGQDVFFDAIPIFKESYGKNLFGTDTITPHKGAFSDPLPLSFLKVMPGISYQFDFRLTDSRVLEGLNKSLKLDIFKQVLLDLGIGAKTNVGYGNFLEPAAFEQVYLSPEELEVILARRKAEKAAHAK